MLFLFLLFFGRNNVGGPTTAIAGFCSYFLDGDKQIVLDRLYDRRSGTTTELLSLSELTGKEFVINQVCQNRQTASTRRAPQA